MGHFSRSVRIFRTPPLGVESLVVLPINPQRLLTKAFCLKARVNNKCDRSWTVVDVLVPCSDVQQTARAELGSTVVTCTVSAAWLSEEFPYFLRDGVLGF